jgi:hypothetical protein
MQFINLRWHALISALSNGAAFSKFWQWFLRSEEVLCVCRLLNFVIASLQAQLYTVILWLVCSTESNVSKPLEIRFH